MGVFSRFVARYGFLVIVGVLLLAVGYGSIHALLAERARAAEGASRSRVSSVQVGVVTSRGSDVEVFDVTYEGVRYLLFKYSEGLVVERLGRVEAEVPGEQKAR